MGLGGYLGPFRARPKARAKGPKGRIQGPRVPFRRSLLGPSNDLVILCTITIENLHKISRLQGLGNASKRRALINLYREPSEGLKGPLAFRRPLKVFKGVLKVSPGLSGILKLSFELFPGLPEPVYLLTLGPWPFKGFQMPFEGL